MNFVPHTFFGLSESEVSLFHQLLADVEGEGVEIGCLDGFSTAHILNCSRLHLTSIDPFVPDSMNATLRGDPERFRQNTEPWRERSTLLKDYSWSAVVGWRTPLDFLFIDGSHHLNDVLRDYEDWTPHLKVGGVLALHDSRIGRPGGPNFHSGPSIVATEQVYNQPDRWEICGEAFSLTAARKRLV